ncbi:dihydropyrimidinase [Futiania mangrovi]|uniref:Dihydropyrimidinase n=1 Tax=Futiania mangrovi TaxID=2959716 RepID=A0A9J6PMA9_9PROT|nr:dihydropyrimidinase [Futiania mangrovii]MCP1337807.1 dihydropyrimidinase [Futiania mangrovii]
MTSTVIRNGRVVTAVDDYVADVLMENGRIVCIGEALQVGAHVAEVDATGMLVLPGGVDCHTHLENTFGESTTADDFRSGTKAAAFGGTTTIVDFAFQGRDVGVMQAIEAARGRAEGKAAVDYGFHLITTHVDDQALADLKLAIRNEGVTSFKMFMAYPGKVMVDDAAIFRAMRLVGQHGGVISLHAENGIVIEQLIREALDAGHTAPKYHGITRPALMEGEATHRGIKLAELAEAPVYFVHLSAREALAQVVEARDRGIPAFAETCPHYLFFDESAYEDDGFDVAKFVMSPPLRSKEAQRDLWRALKFDDLQVIATDHCPYCMKEGHLGHLKQKPFGKDDFSKIPNGAPGLEARMTVIYDGGVRPGLISLNRYVELTATAPAKIFGLFPRKGTIAVGSDADIVIFNPDERHVISAKTHHSDCDYTLFEGREVQGRVKKVFLRGEMIVDGDAWYGRDGSGAFLKRGETVMF